MFAQFQSSFYEKKNTKAIINKTNFINDTLLVVINFSKQNETTKLGPVDVRIELKTPL